MTTTTPTEQLQLLQVAPENLKVRDQVREDATPDDEMIASVRQHGIIQPPVVEYSADDNGYYIVTGHRRVGAAIIAGLPEITVVVRPASAAHLRLEEQIIENERRKQLHQAEVVAGFVKLETLFGQTPEDIAAALAESPDRIRAGLRAHQSARAAKLIETAPQVDLEQAAIIAEFDDNPAAQEELIQAATTKPADFGWRVEKIRREIARDARIAELKKQLRAEKVKLAKVDAYGTYRSPAGAGIQLEYLVDEKGKKITPAKHKGCPGHGAYVTGWDANAVKITYVCNDWRENGHQRPHANVVIDPEAEARRQAAIEKQARIDANQTARRQWIHDLLPGKINQLRGVYEYLAAALLDHSGYYYDDPRAPRHTLPLLDSLPALENLTNAGASQALDELVASKTIAPFRLMLATALGIHEERVERSDPRFTIRHLEQLEAWGYPLSEVDQELVVAAGATITETAEEAAA